MSGYGEITISSTNNGSVVNCANCKQYKGSWYNDLKNGPGKCYDRKGKLIYEGTFVNDEPTGDYPNR